jgi:acetyl esterase/lipase
LSILSNRLVADAVALAFAAAIRPAAKPGVRFGEISGHAAVVAIPTRHGDVAATVYRPPSPAPTPPAVYVNVHGGGFVVGHREQDDPWCRYLAANANVVVINTDYVLAPRRRFPAPVEQIYDVLKWASSDQHDWDGARLCVGGQSAGGNLAAAASRLALENGGPEVRLQVLHYAPLDLVTNAAAKATPLGSRAVLRPWMSEVFDTAYLPDVGQRRDPLASPAWGANGIDLHGIAPALVITAEYDRLRDEAAAYAHGLDAVGSLAGYHDVPGVDHGYNIMSDATEVTQRMYALIAEYVTRHTDIAEIDRTT